MAHHTLSHLIITTTPQEIGIIVPIYKQGSRDLQSLNEQSAQRHSGGKRGSVTRAQRLRMYSLHQMSTEGHHQHGPSKLMFDHLSQKAPLFLCNFSEAQDLPWEICLAS